MDNELNIIEIYDFILTEFKQNGNYSVDKFFSLHSSKLTYYNINAIYQLESVFKDLQNHNYLGFNDGKYFITVKGVNAGLLENKYHRKQKLGKRQKFEKYIPWIISALLLFTNLYTGIYKVRQQEKKNRDINIEKQKLQASTDSLSAIIEDLRRELNK